MLFKRFGCDGLDMQILSLIAGFYCYHYWFVAKFYLKFWISKASYKCSIALVEDKLKENEKRFSFMSTFSCINVSPDSFLDSWRSNRDPAYSYRAIISLYSTVLEFFTLFCVALNSAVGQLRITLVLLFRTLFSLVSLWSWFALFYGLSDLCIDRSLCFW